MTDQVHNSGGGSSSGDLFYTMPYAPAKGAHVIRKENNNEKQIIHYRRGG